MFFGPRRKILWGSFCSVVREGFFPHSTKYSVLQFRSTHCLRRYVLPVCVCETASKPRKNTPPLVYISNPKLTTFWPLWEGLFLKDEAQIPSIRGAPPGVGPTGGALRGAAGRLQLRSIYASAVDRVSSTFGTVNPGRKGTPLAERLNVWDESNSCYFLGKTHFWLLHRLLP